MEKLEIKGGRKVSGTVEISGSKNATLPILASTILTNKKIIIKNIPIVKDVETMVTLLSTMGSNIYGMHGILEILFLLPHESLSFYYLQKILQHSLHLTQFLSCFLLFYPY